MTTAGKAAILIDKLGLARPLQVKFDDDDI